MDKSQIVQKRKSLSLRDLLQVTRATTAVEEPKAEADKDDEDSPVENDYKAKYEEALSQLEKLQRENAELKQQLNATTIHVKIYQA